MHSQIQIRALKPTDVNFIFSTMLRGLYYASGSIYSLMDKEAFFEHYDEVLQKLLRASSTVVKIACLEAEPDIILGYALLAYPGILHYVYVKPAWRGQYIAESLCKGSTHVTHVLPILEDLRLRKGLKYNPFLKGAI